LGLSSTRREAAYRSAEGWSEVRRTTRLNIAVAFRSDSPYFPSRPSKNPANSHVKPSTPKNHHQKIHKQLKINHLQVKNKSAKTGILVSLN